MKAADLVFIFLSFSFSKGKNGYGMIISLSAQVLMREITLFGSVYLIQRAPVLTVLMIDTIARKLEMLWEKNEKKDYPYKPPRVARIRPSFRVMLSPASTPKSPDSENPPGVTLR